MTTDRDRRGAVYYIGTIAFAAMAVVLVVAFVKKRRLRDDWPDDG